LKNVLHLVFHAKTWPAKEAEKMEKKSQDLGRIKNSSIFWD